MNKKVKRLISGLVIGVIGAAATIGVMVGTGALMSREAEKTYHFDEPFTAYAFPDPERVSAEVDFMQGDEYRAEAYIKAWRPEPIDIDELVSLEVKDGVLYITQTPFPDDFLGFFPQPYELRLTVYAPAELFEQQHIEGGAE
jgi:hypothetical protein